MNKLLVVSLAVAGVFTLSSCGASESFPVLDGVITDKYMTASKDIFGGVEQAAMLRTEAEGDRYEWFVTDVEYNDCEIGDNFHMNADGDITCAEAASE